jgi:hypothetical protein
MQVPLSLGFYATRVSTCFFLALVTELIVIGEKIQLLLQRDFLIDCFEV